MSEFFIIISKFINDQKELPMYTGHKQRQHKIKRRMLEFLLLFFLIGKKKYIQENC